MVDKEEITIVSINHKGEFFPLIKSINMISEIFKYLDFLDLLKTNPIIWTGNEEIWQKKAMSLILNIVCISGKLDFSFLLTNFNSRFSYKDVSFLKLFFEVMKMNGNIISLDLGDQLANIYIYIYI